MVGLVPLPPQGRTQGAARCTMLRKVALVTAATCGFLCPECQHCCADVIGRDLVHILELRCQQCGNEYAVEAT